MEGLMKRIKGYEKYSITEDGMVFSHKTKKYLSLCDNGCGYLAVNLWVNGIRTNHFVHRLVAAAFIECISGGLQVNHKDWDKKNNHYSNLEWVTREDNMAHAVRLGISGRGTKHKRNSTGYVGVHKLKHNGRYQAHIKVDGKSKAIGVFNEAIDAALARDEASLIYHGNTGKLNFPIAI